MGVVGGGGGLRVERRVGRDAWTRMGEKKGEDRAETRWDDVHMTGDDGVIETKAGHGWQSMGIVGQM